MESPGFHYRVCGLSVLSEIAIPGDVALAAPCADPDVCVLRGVVPEALVGASHVGPTWQVAGQSFLWRVPGVGRFLVSAGREIVVAAAAMGDADLAPFVLGTGFGAVLHLRGELVLHAAAVSCEGRAVALSGGSGVGKSTLAAALCRAGCGFISDDVSAIRFGEDGRPVVAPDGRRHRLWADAVERLALTGRQGAPVRPGLGKFHVAPATMAAASLPLAAVVVLRSSAQPRRPELRALNLSDAAAVLRQEVYRRALATCIGRDVALFNQVAALLGQVRVFRLDRMKGCDRLDDTVRMLLVRLRDGA